MKLKLENQDQATVLIVTESVEPSHIPILKAGLTKLFQTGKKSIILDFSQVTEKDFKDPALLPQIAELRSWAQSSDAQVIVVSAIQSLGHAPTRADAIKLLGSALGQLQAKEAYLQTELKSLEQKKATLLQRLGNTSGDELKKLQSENTRLRRSLQANEKLAKKFLKLRTKDPMQVPAVQVNLENLQKLVDSFLQGEKAAAPSAAPAAAPAGGPAK